jgi:ABC-2 type transport system permease protein
VSVPPLESAAGAPSVAAAAATGARPFLWSVRRELWEHRSVSVAPLAVAAAMLVAFLFSLITLPERRRALLQLAAAQQRAAIEKPYDQAAVALCITALLVGFYYSLEALYGERRDRSILFWKSLPVSDRSAVLAKASVPLAVLPLLTFGLVLLTQAVMLVLSSAVLILSGVGAGATWTHLHWFEGWPILLYGLLSFAAWQAPLHGWLLLVSGWARRAPFLWAVLPPLAVCMLEKVAFDSARFAGFLGHRFAGHLPLAFAFDANGDIRSLTQLTPGRFLGAPGLWFGLAAAAALLAAAERLRRRNGPA